MESNKIEALKIYLFKSSINFTLSIEITFEIIHWFLKYHVYVRFRKRKERETKNKAESNKKGSLRYTKH